MAVIEAVLLSPFGLPILLVSPRADPCRACRIVLINRGSSSALLSIVGCVAKPVLPVSIASFSPPNAHFAGPFGRSLFANFSILILFMAILIVRAPVLYKPASIPITTLAVITISVVIIGTIRSILRVIN